ncbi:hypothetical protein D9M68_713910 [compost metagenome]
MAGFGDFIADLDDAVMGSLSDGVADYLSRAGEVLAPAISVIVELDVERIADTELGGVGGVIERVRTHCVQKRLLVPFDRQGAFLMDGKTWHIDGIHEDDGHLITFYVVP